MRHGVDDFCRIGTPKACLSSEAGMWVSELISNNKACSGPSYSVTTEPTEITLFKCSLDMYLTLAFKQVCVYLK